MTEYVDVYIQTDIINKEDVMKYSVDNTNYHDGTGNTDEIVNLNIRIDKKDLPKIKDMALWIDTKSVDESVIQSFNQFNENKNWIKDAIRKPGSLRRSMKKRKGEKISNTEIDSELQALKGKDKDKKKPGVQGLGKNDMKKFRRLNLAKTLKGLKEHNDTQNYMFFNNLETIKRLSDRLSDMDEQTIDKLLTEHDWASDHMSVATENLEHVFNFLEGIMSQSDNPENIQKFNNFK